jgi:polar amino acid transport system permease protein
VPLTHLVNYIDARLRTGRAQNRAEKREPDEVAAVVGKGAHE